MATTPQSASLASTLVARFLRSNNYSDTLNTFIREAGLSADVGQTDSGNDWTIEGVLEEKKAFDKSVNFERYNEDEKKDVWTVPAPSKPTIIQTPTSSNLLAASVEPWQQQPNDKPSPCLVATGADRQLHVFKTAEGNELVKSFAGHSDSPILSYVSVRNGRYVFMTNMSGQLILQRGEEVLGKRKDHGKYAVKVVAHEDPSGRVLVATAGWDSKICIYEFNIPEGDEEVAMDQPVAYINLDTNPETMLFVRHVDLGHTLLLVSRRDSTHLYYYQVDSTGQTTPYECRLLGKQNLAPHSNAWVTFSPSSLALHPDDPGLLAVATSSLPHMKVIIVRLLFPSAESFNPEFEPQPPTEPITQATQAFEALALQNREDAAILIQANAFAPQTAYSTPQVMWRPDGSGVWVNGDDGVVRGVEARTGKVVGMLKMGHDVGCKVRTIWAGWVEVEGVKEEWVVSGGFDKKLIVWKG
ncbi:hypothetical protein SI65_01692 [Aspergillus cristatus]|uniref:Uncharacterized protein n=1 Tax=Aspergillus cristatus TaxID=573508 RepID=A0A1E3BT10_ASPCR|nr:hypothetical protein SI65_01692 [Aspergillus cristatus]